MAVIKSGASTDQLTVDPTSKAARVTLYDFAGNAILPTELARCTSNILVRQTATTAAGAAVWAIRNSSAARTVVILGVSFHCAFDGTGAATLMRYEFLKATTVTAFSGGTQVTSALHKTSLSAPLAETRVLDTGLTLTGAAFGGPIYTATHGRITPSATALAAGPQHVLPFSVMGMGPLELAQNECLVLRNGPTNASVVGDSVFGTVFFIEK